VRFEQGIAVQVGPSGQELATIGNALLSSDGTQDCVQLVQPLDVEANCQLFVLVNAAPSAAPLDPSPRSASSPGREALLCSSGAF
jgi:hypothetical protein